MIGIYLEVRWWNYTNLFRCLFCFHCRRWVLERRLASSDVPKEEQINLIKDLERKETEFMRLKRHKTCVNDFELLTIIGRGAFGEVRDVLDIFTLTLLEITWLTSVGQ